MQQKSHISLFFDDKQKILIKGNGWAYQQIIIRSLVVIKCFDKLIISSKMQNDIISYHLSFSKATSLQVCFLATI